MISGVHRSSFDMYTNRWFSLVMQFRTMCNNKLGYLDSRSDIFGFKWDPLIWCPLVSDFISMAGAIILMRRLQTGPKQ